VYKRLWPIRDYLQSEDQFLFETLESEFKDTTPIEYLSFLSYISDVGFVRNISSKTAAELLEMSESEILIDLEKTIPLTELDLNRQQSMV
jgi:hypothetical protein